MKKWIWIILAAYFAGTITTISVLSFQLKSRTEVCDNLKERTAEQSRVIDSLLNRRMTVFDVQMHVRDQSKFTKFGKHPRQEIHAVQLKDCMTRKDVPLEDAL